MQLFYCDRCGKEKAYKEVKFVGQVKICAGCHIETCERCEAVDCDLITTLECGDYISFLCKNCYKIVHPEDDY